MSTRYQAPRGTQDVLPALQPYWHAVLDQAREVARLHGFSRIDTPAFELAAVFEKGSGDTTDIVEKEMYTFTDRGDEQLALTPEGTPAICRAYLEHGMSSLPQPVRLYTTKAMFRYDRPQKGRYRQHSQFDCEVLGSTDPLVDAEVIEVLWELTQRLGLRELEVRLGSIDDPGPRLAYVERLKEYYRPLLAGLSEDSKRRFDRNPLRLLDSKDERDLAAKDAAPKLVESLSPQADAHHRTVQDALAAAGIPVRIDPLLVRGLDYYNRTVFEIVPLDDERAQGTLGGGGRYDGLMEILGGPPTGGMGFGSGIERLILEMQKNGIVFDAGPQADVFIVHRAEGGQSLAFGLASRIRGLGIAAQLGESGRSFKSQLRSANASGAAVALIIGDEELRSGAVILKELRTDGEQQTLPVASLPSALAERFAPA